MALWRRLSISILFFAVNAWSDESSVYTCRFANDNHGFSSVRMKKFFSPTDNMELGKVDLIQNFIVVESTATKIYQIPLWERDTFIQIWYSPTVRVDAQLSYSQGSAEFSATYSKGSDKFALVCVELK